VTLTDEQVRRFREEGYLRLDPFIPGEELGPLRERIEAMVSGRTALPPQAFQTLDPKVYRTPNGLPVPEGIQGPSKYDPAFERVAGHPALVAAMRRLIGEDAALFTDQVIVKNPEAGVTTYYHQDGFYWRSSGRRTVNCWIALDDADAGNGALRFMPGSQKGGLIEHEAYFDEPTLHSGVTGEAFRRLRIPLERVDFSRERVEPVRAGGCLLFGKLCWHRSDPNRSGRQRRAYAVAYHGTNPALDEA
jgi:hypothetical protein